MRIDRPPTFAYHSSHENAGGEDRPEEARDRPGKAEPEAEDGAGDEHGQEHPRHRQQHHRPDVGAQAMEVGGDRGLEEQDGQEDLDDDLRVEADVGREPFEAFVKRAQAVGFLQDSGSLERLVEAP